MDKTHSISFVYRREFSGKEIFISTNSDGFRAYALSHTSSQVLSMFGFVIPDEITYCIAQSENYYLMYRCTGCKIEFFIHDL